MCFFFYIKTEKNKRHGKRLRKLDGRTNRAIKQYNDIKGYETELFESDLVLTEDEMMIIYLSEGNPAEAKRIRDVSKDLVMDYYYQNRVNDLNKLLEHLAYLEHLEENKD